MKIYKEDTSRNIDNQSNEMYARIQEQDGSYSPASVC